MKNRITAHGRSFEPMISSQTIADRVGDLGLALRTDFGDKCPLFLCVLNGAFVFAADLTRAFAEPCEVAFVRLSSYKGTASTGEVTTVLDVDIPLDSRHVVIVEDIVDTGRTLHFFLEKLKDSGAASVSLAALLFKPSALQFGVKIDYLGFEIPEKFVVGYGLDYDGLCRNLPDIYQLAETP